MVSAFVHFSINEIFDAAIGALGEFEVDRQYKVAIFFQCDNITAVCRFTTVGGHNLDYTIFDNPSFFRECRESRTTPAVGCFTVKE